MDEKTWADVDGITSSETNLSQRHHVSTKSVKVTKLTAWTRTRSSTVGGLPLGGPPKTGREVRSGHQRDGGGGATPRTNSRSRTCLQSRMSEQINGTGPIPAGTTHRPNQNKRHLCSRRHLYPAQTELPVRAAEWCLLSRLTVSLAKHGVCVWVWGGAPVVPSAVNTSLRLHPRLGASIQRSDCRLLYDCLVSFCGPSSFSAPAPLISGALPGQRSHCLFK